MVQPIILAGSLLLQLSTPCSHSHGAAGEVDPSFDPGSSVNGPVTTIALQPDGKVIIGGGFTTVKGLVRSGVARLNADGSGDSSFKPTAGNAADRAIALQPDGKVIVGNYSGIARLHYDGSLDTNFFANIDSLYDEYYGYAAIVESIAVQSDGKVIIGGDFYIVNGPSVNYGIARLNANGSLDNSFSAPLLEAYYYPRIYSVALQPDGKVLVGGLFGNGTNNNIARLNANGSLDNSFRSGAGANSTVNSVVAQSDGKILIGGDFTMVNGTNRNRIARLNTDGSLDNSFNPGTGVNSPVSEVAFQSDGKVLIGGSFTDFNGTERNSIARLNANGSLDVTFNPSTGVDPNYPVVRSLAVQSDGKVLIGGFTTVYGKTRIARLNADGSLDDGFYPGRGLEYPVYSLEVQPDGKVLIGATRLNWDGSLDSTYTYVPNTNFNPNIGIPGTDYSVTECSALQADGKVLIGGYTATIIAVDDFGNQYFSFGCFVARVNADGSRDTNFHLALGGHGSGWVYPDPWSPTVRTLTVQPDGKILVGGLFWEFEGTNRNGIVRLNANGDSGQQL